jgi:hypothetical protein
MAPLLASVLAAQPTAVIPICRLVAVSLCGRARRYGRDSWPVHRPQATRVSTGRSPGPAGKPGGVMHMQGPLKASLPTAGAWLCT